MEETREDRFKRLATKRTNEIINKIRILGNTSNKSMYEFSESDVNKIFNHIQEEIKKNKARFKFSNKKSNFTL
jgi:hypothetical protein